MRVAISSDPLFELVGRERLVGPTRAAASTPEIESPVSIISMRGAHAEEPRVELHVGRAEAHRGVADLGVLGDVDEVAAGGELAAAGEAVAVHLRDDRLGQIPDAHPAVGDVTRPLALAPGGVVRQLVALVAAAEVVARGEARAGAADDRDAHVVVGVGGPQLLEELAPQRMVQRVALLGPVERDAADLRRGFVDEDQFAHLIALGSMSVGQSLQRLVRNRVDRLRHLFDRRPELRGERRERVQVEVVEAGGVAGEDLRASPARARRGTAPAGVRGCTATCLRRGGSRFPT